MIDHDPVPVSPMLGDPQCVTAAGLLYGNALIVGGGRFVGPRAAVMNTSITALDVVEIDEELASEGRLLLAGIEGPARVMDVNVFAADILSWQPHRQYESMFYDPWPMWKELLRQFTTATKFVIPGGRIIGIDEQFDELAESLGLEIEYDLKVGNYYKQTRVKTWRAPSKGKEG